MILSHPIHTAPEQHPPLSRVSPAKPQGRPQVRSSLSGVAAPAPAITITGITAARQKAGALRADGLIARLDIVVIQLCAALRAGLHSRAPQAF